MIIFLSYASEQRDAAEQVNLALTGSGHKVFFDREKLPAGDNYHLGIRKAVEDSDAFVFLISPNSVTVGCYALTELKYARQRWPDPRRKVLPVMIELTEYSQVPNYLKAVTVLEPEGNVPAEVVAELDKWSLGDDARHTVLPPQDRLTHSPAASSIDGARIGRFVGAAVLSFLGLIFVLAGLIETDNARAFLFGIPCLATAYWLFTKK
jgi:TIR domain